MATHTINLNQESEEMLKAWKSEDREFNFSKFIQEAMRGDENILTEGQIKHIIKMDRIEAKALQDKITHLETILPAAIEKNKVFESKKNERLDGKIRLYKESDTYKKWTKEKEKKWAKIYAPLVNLEYEELLEKCKSDTRDWRTI